MTAPTPSTSSTSYTSSAPNQVLRRVFSAFDRGDWTVFDNHPGLYETSHHLPHLYAAFPDLHHTIDTEVVQGSLIGCVATVRGTHLGPFMGVAPTGKEVSFMLLTIERIVDGEIVEHWAIPDFMGLFQQLGVTVSLAAASPCSPERPSE